MKQFDIVKVTAIRDGRFSSAASDYLRPPSIGDVGTILEVYADAYEVECSGRDGHTIWLEAMYPDELALVSAGSGM